jgi:hypothetical protein
MVSSIVSIFPAGSLAGLVQMMFCAEADMPMQNKMIAVAVFFIR